MFENDPDWLKGNLQAAERLIKALGSLSSDDHTSKGPWIWRNVKLPLLETFFKEYRICSRVHLSETVLDILKHTQKMIAKERQEKDPQLS